MDNELRVLYEKMCWDLEVRIGAVSLPVYKATGKDPTGQLLSISSSPGIKGRGWFPWHSSFVGMRSDCPCHICTLGFLRKFLDEASFSLLKCW